jgi:hypothetical protein
MIPTPPRPKTIIDVANRQHHAIVGEGDETPRFYNDPQIAAPTGWQ